MFQAPAAAEDTEGRRVFARKIGRVVAIGGEYGLPKIMLGEVSSKLPRPQGTALSGI